MREGTELKDTILHQAEELFIAQGFAGTSIKQIANASGCTTAALYYYFPEGKSQLLREVVQCTASAEVTLLVEAGQNASNLGEWLRAFGRAAMQSILEMQRRNNWILMEIHQLGSAELTTIEQHGLMINRMIAKEISRFVSDQAEATRLAWLLMCAVFGYGQLFLRRDIQQVANFGTEAFVETLVATLGQASK